MSNEKSKPAIDFDIHTLDGEHNSFCDEYYIVAMPKGMSQPNNTDVTQFFSSGGGHRPIGIITLDHFFASKMARIVTMDSDYPRRGIGRALLARTAIFAKGLGAETLYVNSVDSAIQFYEKQGMMSEPGDPKTLSMSLVNADK